MGLLALGALLSELVTSAGRCGCAHSMDHAEWSDLAIRRGLRRRAWVIGYGPRVSQGIKDAMSSINPNAEQQINGN